MDITGSLATSRETSNVADFKKTAATKTINASLTTAPQATELVENIAMHSTAGVEGKPDFYCAHVMNFCEGQFVVTNQPPLPTSMVKNVTYCSKTTFHHTFDLRTILQSRVNINSSDTADLHWPAQIDTGFESLRAAQRAVIVLYYISIACMLTAAAVTTVNRCDRSSTASFLICGLEGVGLCALFLAALLVNGVAIKSTRLIRTHGGGLGISASIGVKFILLSWGAWLALLAAVISLSV